MRTLPAFFILLPAVTAAFAQQPEPKEKMRTISVRGEGTVATAPDQVRVSVQVSTREESASTAMRSASSKTQAILSLLKNLGVDEKSIQTSRVNVSPVYDYSRQIQPPPIVGYTSSNDFTVLFKGKLMDKVGEFMDKAVAAGAANFGGLQYESSKQREIEREALKKAADDAKARAEVLAKQLGATLGQVTTISESVSGGGPGPMLMRGNAMMEASSAAPVMQGELSIRADVHVVFELK
ncbi:MAG: SIMPL domain-containing protein [Bacteroidetes bacterium]|nr:SIMPL domain-containing protein [Bacteroidota bacterium]MCW5895774.1 SIMPL domain-containing protein [Bacteroidota bacterium]